jgi:ABC-type multidrug transport system ATPase subunit
VVGPSGAGKTTLIDSFVNSILGIEFYDNFRYKLIDETEQNLKG